MKTILDVSSVVYGGHYGAQDRRISGFPIGGLRKLFGIINASLANSDFVLCFDGGVSDKVQLDPEYKAGRVPNYSVYAQLDLAQEMLQDCGIPFYIKQGIEADEWVCSVVSQLSKVGDPDPITIYSDDQDLACCVSSQVQIHNVTENGKCLTRDNYESRLSGSRPILYNTILLYKMIHGDKSDNYKSLKLPGVRYEDMAYNLTQMMAPYLANGSLPESAYMDIEVTKVLIDSMSDSLSKESRDILLKRAELVFPRLVDVTTSGVDTFMCDLQTSGDPIYTVEGRHMKIFGIGDVNSAKFNMYCNVLGLNRCRPDRLFSYQEMAESFRARLHLLAKDLADGTFAVEKFSKRKAQISHRTVIENMQLPQ